MLRTTQKATTEKPVMTGHEIHTVVMWRVNQLPAVIADRTIDPGMWLWLMPPYWHEPDERGRDWDISWGHGIGRYKESIERIIAEAREAFSLTPSATDTRRYVAWQRAAASGDRRGARRGVALPHPLAA
jgi:hypothetical protein